MRFTLNTTLISLLCFNRVIGLTVWGFQQISTLKHEAMKQFIALKNFANKEYHVLTLQKNKEAVNKNRYLSHYQGFFTHLHFITGKIPFRLLQWNLDEFHQANIGFRL